MPNWCLHKGNSDMAEWVYSKDQSLFELGCVREAIPCVEHVVLNAGCVIWKGMMNLNRGVEPLVTTKKSRSK